MNSPYRVGRWIVDLFDAVAGEFGPERVTLGTLRHRGGQPKDGVLERGETLVRAAETLKCVGYEGEVGLCKENPAMIADVLGIEPEEMVCNCLP